MRYWPNVSSYNHANTNANAHNKVTMDSPRMSFSFQTHKKHNIDPRNVPSCCHANYINTKVQYQCKFTTQSDIIEQHTTELHPYDSNMKKDTLV